MFASKHRQVVEADGLAAFIEMHEGIAGCAAKAANPKSPAKLKVKLRGDDQDVVACNMDAMDRSCRAI